MAEQLICNQQVVGSIPIASSRSERLGSLDSLHGGRLLRRCFGKRLRVPLVDEERFPSGQREQTVNLPPSGFGGSNPPLSTIYLI